MDTWILTNRFIQGYSGNINDFMLSCKIDFSFKLREDFN